MTTHSDERPTRSVSRPVEPTRSPSGVLIGSATCPNCATDRQRGDVHRCAAPDLVALPAAAVKLLDAVRSAGGYPLIVGGAVRDALATRSTPVAPKDIDIEVFGVDTLDQLRPHLAAVARVDDAGASFGILVATAGGLDFDISVAGEQPTPAGEAAAFARRDFTVNALGWDPSTSELIDVWGGATDLDHGILQHVGPSFPDDALRPLRAAQFVARFGWMVADETINACWKMRDLYDTLPSSRVWGEWKKLATRGIYISRALTMLEQTGWLDHFPALAATRDAEQDPTWHPEGDVLTHLGLSADVAAAAAAADQLPAEQRLLAVLGALVHDVGKPFVTTTHDNGRVTSHGHESVGDPVAQDFLTGIGSPHVTRDRIGGLVAEHMCHVSTIGKPTKSAVRRLVRRLDERSGLTIHDWARVVDADVAGRGPSASGPVSGPWVELATEVGPKPRKSLLTGHHLMSLGYKPGPAFKDIIKAAVDAQDNGEFDDEAGAIAWFVAQEVPHVS
ncbi:CCA tRNA nucleotidyltransferase [Frigoribacterium sp. SL97]|uniref:CCA tRNA nucleotidyltransferase n=1 Tax=Frigoribacterium sp. SL97 TaxID=2994664 RepID=UPI002271912A|nr:HD domain-containing protein [Frigoribacterium sp. SL97]WAC50463.1 HD domain-containing protein [Frigoribacterium sp. SL97]